MANGFQVNVPPPTPGIQPFGVAGAEDITGRGALMGLDITQQTQQQVGQGFEQGIGGLQPFVAPGQQAQQQQAALSGALGPEAQAQAFQAFQASPGQQFLQEQGQRAILRNAAATGGLGGGNVQRELAQFGQGLALQDLEAQFGRLGDVATRGLQGATTIGGLRGQEAGLQAGLGRFAAGIPVQTGQQLGAQRFQAGRDISGAVGGTTSALANLTQTQGAGISDLVRQATAGDVNAKTQLAQMLANMSAQQGGQVGGLPIIPGATTNTLGQLAQLAGGVGGILEHFPGEGG